ncbi:XrtA/PEP-CTERM system TPR-repeat protein PrsT [Methylomonas koyamae]|uniref:XrtA/PEP-CTERM system TPR-repeat protein PrsT n=2 Tax=Methylomonas koyamae TaxID=702114 RepID=UPI001C33803C|nr:XrtA/PEP-CTERM system TPR-repeat protein PrsT [Methylomonas koyamae]BBL57815.1 hypothetical protein MKFW12EY_14280 [Methylomonas koyamae]
MLTILHKYASMTGVVAALLSFQAGSAFLDKEIDIQDSRGNSQVPTSDLASSFARNTKNSPAEFDAVLKLLNEKKFDKAIEEAEKLKSKYPTRMLPRNLLGMAYMGNGNHEQARQQFEAVLESSPGDPSASGALAALALNKNDISQARSYYEQVINKNPKHLDTMILLAGLEIKAGDRNRAIQWLTKAGQQKSKSLRSIVAIAKSLLQLSEPDQALQVLNDTDPSAADNPDILILKGVTNARLNRLEATEQAFRRLIHLNPGVANSHFLLAQAYAGFNKLDKLKIELTETLRIDPSHLQANSLMGRVLLNEGRLEEAKKLLAEMKRTFPDNPVVLAHEGWLHENQNDFAGAITAYSNAINIDSNSPQLLSRLAMAQLKAKKGEDSLRTLNGWLEKHPQDLSILGLRAQVNHLLGKYEAAIEDYKVIVERSPNDALALNNLAWFLRDKAPIQAREYSARAFELAPTSSAVLDTRAMLLMDQGDLQQALKISKKAAEIQPNDFNIQYHLALISASGGHKQDASSILKMLLATEAKFSERLAAEKLYKDLTN